MVTPYFIFWFSCVHKLDRILGTTNLFKISFRTHFFRACRTTKWLSDVSFWSSFIVLFFKNVSWHTYETLKKPWEDPLAKLGGVKFAIYQSGTLGVAVIKYFQTRLFQATFWLNSAYNAIFRVQIRLVQSRQQHFKVESLLSERPVLFPNIIIACATYASSITQPFSVEAKAISRENCPRDDALRMGGGGGGNMSTIERSTNHS